MELKVKLFDIEEVLTRTFKISKLSTKYSEQLINSLVENLHLDIESEDDQYITMSIPKSSTRITNYFDLFDTYAYLYAKELEIVRIEDPVDLNGYPIAVIS